MMQMFGDIFVVMPDAGTEDARRGADIAKIEAEAGRWNDTFLHRCCVDISAGLQ